jgi:hypothetical protein
MTKGPQQLKSLVIQHPFRHSTFFRHSSFVIDAGVPMLSLRKHCLRWVVPLLVVTCAGCGDNGPTIVPVTGTLTYKGKPITNARVDFLPEHGRESWGVTDEQGHFTLNYDRGHDGAVVGKHTVSVRPRPTKVKEQEAVMMGKKMPLSKDMASFFEKYSPKNSKVEVVVDKNTRELKLDWD